MKVTIEGKYYKDVVSISFEINVSSRMVLWMEFPDGSLESVEFFDIEKVSIVK